MKPMSPHNFRELARRRLPHFLFEYIDGGANSETTLQRNEQELQRVQLQQRILSGVTEVDLSTELLGQRYNLPIGLGPIGLAGMAARRGEVQAVKAADSMGVPFCLSTVSACPLDEVAAAAPQPFWFQLYMIKDRVFMRDLLQRAKELGCSALVFTVDMPVPGIRYRDYQSGLAGASGLVGQSRRAWQAMCKPKWAWDVGVMGRPHQLGNVAPVLEGNTGLEDFFAWMGNNFDPSVTWQDIDFIRQQWDGPLIIKGVMNSDDAKQAAAVGADAVVVSNHGGRQLDGAPATVSVLPTISAAVGNEMTVLVDGGVRTGVDVLRMLALGADGVLLGRAWVYALAAHGQAGVEQLLELMAEEMRVAMTLTGVSSIEEITPEILSSQ